MTTTLVAMIGGWELLLILIVLAMLVGLPLVALAVVMFIVSQKRKRGEHGRAVPPVIGTER